MLSGYVSNIFWRCGDAYKEEGKYDRLCFYDMKKVNFIEKDAIPSIFNNDLQVQSTHCLPVLNQQSMAGRRHNMIKICAPHCVLSSVQTTTEDYTRNVYQWPHYNFPARYTKPKSLWTPTAPEICAAAI
ncbi:DUF943 family protein [Pantoea allii]|nr:DUF943 family protein [Pantoea allii]